MLDSAAITSSASPNAQSLHHDLWVELARIEMAMEILNGNSDIASCQKRRLENRRLQLNRAMQQLPD